MFTDLLSRLRQGFGWLFEAQMESWVRVIHMAGAILFVQWFSFRLGIASSLTALSAAIIVSQPMVGMMYAKAVNRLVGTILGALVSLLLIALFAQTPVLFFLALIAWVGFCTWLSSHIWKPLEYMAQLSGYTLAMIALQALAVPEQAFGIAINRVTNIGIGILAIAALSTLFVPVSARTLLLKQARKTIDSTLLMMRNVLNGLLHQDAKCYQQAQLGSISEILALEQMRINAYLEKLSHGHVYQRSTALIQQQLNVVTYLHLLAHQLAEFMRHHPHALQRQLIDQLASFANALEQHQHCEQREGLVQVLCLQLKALADFEQQVVTELLAMERPKMELRRLLISVDLACDSIRTLLSSLRQVQLVEQPDDRAQDRNEAIHFGLHTFSDLSWLRALRPMVAIAVGLVIWYFTAWPQGHTLLMMPIILPTLFAAFPVPRFLARQICIGTLLGCFVGYLVNFILLPGVDGFILYSLVQLPIIVIFGLLICNLPTLAIGFTAILNFYMVFQTSNTPTYNIHLFIEQALATGLGTLVGCLALLWVFPENAERTRRSINRQMFAEVGDLCAEQLHDRLAFESRMYDRLRHLNGHLRHRPEHLVTIRQLTQTLALSEYIGRYQGVMEDIPGIIQAHCQAYVHSLVPWLKRCSDAGGMVDSQQTIDQLNAQLPRLIARLRSHYQEADSEERLSLVRVGTILEIIPLILERMQSVEAQRVELEAQ